MKDEQQFPFDDVVKGAWGSMWETPAQEYRIMVFRLEPQTVKGTKISGYLESFHLPATIPDIIEKIGVNYGGGMFQIRIVDDSGKYVKSKQFTIAGFPKIPSSSEGGSEEDRQSTTETQPDSRYHLMRLAAYDLMGNSVPHLQGFLERIEATMPTPQIIEHTEQKYGGGKYQLRLLNEGSVYTKSIVFDIAGASKKSALVSAPNDGGKVKIFNTADGGPYFTGPITMNANAAKQNDQTTAGTCRCNPAQLLSSGCSCGGT